MFKRLEQQKRFDRLLREEVGDVCAKAGGQGVLRLPLHGAPPLPHHLGCHSQQIIYIFRNPKYVAPLQKKKSWMIDIIETWDIRAFWNVVINKLMIEQVFFIAV